MSLNGWGRDEQPALNSAPATGGGRVNIDPDYLCIAVDTMGWRELELTARAVLRAFSYVAEAPGAQLRETMTARAKSGSSIPRSTPVCKCGCPSQRDHWQAQLDLATDRDVARATVDDGSVPVDVEPTSFRDAVFRASEDLASTRNDSGRQAHTSSTAGPEWADFVCARYQGVPAQRVAIFESRRRGAGFVSAGTVRRTRARNNHGAELGEPVPPDEELADQVLIAHRSGSSDREIARDLDIGRRAVSAMLEGKRTILNGQEAA